jgi:peptidoglycan/LPS O-acetylase OafA/YrhL
MDKSVAELEYNKNSISLIRMISAVAVMLWHTIAHLELMLPDWFNAIIGWVPAVPVFLSISGYLIWNSIDRSPSYLSYLKKRFIRIYPELWVAVIIEIVVLMVLFGTGGNISALFLFFFAQATIFQFWTPGSLRGYGCGTPNGALGTISSIIQFYFIAWFLKKWLKGKKLPVWILAWLGSVLISILGHKLLGRGPSVMLKLYDVSIFRFLWLFLGGVLCFRIFREDSAIA